MNLTVKLLFIEQFDDCLIPFLSIMSDMEGRTVTPRCWTVHLLISVLLAIISPFTLQRPLDRDCHGCVLF